MNILHVNTNYLHAPLHSELILQLEKLNVRNTVLVPRKRNDNKHISAMVKEHNGKVYTEQILNKFDRFKYFHKQNKIKVWINKQGIKENEYDLIHSHTLFSDGYFAYKSSTPYVVTVRNTDVNYYLKYMPHLKPLGKKILSNASSIVFLSENYRRKTLSDLYKNPHEQQEIYNKSYIIPSGINSFWIEEQNNKPKKITPVVRVLYVGRIMKNKNITFILDNLKFLSTEVNFEFHVVGEVVEENYFKKLTNYNEVKYHGKLEKEKIKELMNEVHLFAMISHNETFGLVYLEALTQGLPILYTKNQGFDQYFKDGFVGYPVNSRSNKDFQLKFKELLKNYEYIQRNVTNLNKEKFSWENNAIKHLKLYSKVDLS